jgi:hypothetical protein
MAGRGWDKRFDMPIELPDGTMLKTLRDAIKHLAATVLAKERDMPQVKTAADLLTRAAEGSDAWLFFARAAVGQACTGMMFVNSIDMKAFAVRNCLAFIMS